MKISGLMKNLSISGIDEVTKTEVASIKMTVEYDINLTPESAIKALGVMKDSLHLVEKMLAKAGIIATVAKEGETK